MPLTKEEKAFHTRKMKTRFSQLDIDGDNLITVKDWQEMERRFIEYGKPSAEQVKRIKDGVKNIYQNILKMGEGQMTQQQFLDVTGSFIPVVDPKVKQMAKEAIPAFFDAIDTNGNGVISHKEFEVYFKCMNVPVEHAKASFDAIDTNKDGIISRDEFLDCGMEFIFSAKHSNADLFYGPLV